MMGVALAFAFPLEGTACVRLEWSQKFRYDNRYKKCLSLNLPIEGINDGCMAGGSEKYGIFCWFQTLRTCRADEFRS